MSCLTQPLAEARTGWLADSEAPVPELFRIPYSVSCLGISEVLVVDLFLKHLFQAGTGTLGGLSSTMKLPAELVEGLFHQLKSQKLIEVKGMYGEDYQFCLSLAGKTMAADRMQVSRYMGPVPVPLTVYEEAVRSQVARTKVNRKRLDEAYGDLTLDPELLNRLGPALVSQRSMFLYGPSGTGKSSLAERLLRIFNEAIAIPYAIEVDGIIITFFDAAVHRPMPDQPPGRDPRWIYCSRPCIIVGGELVSAMLELQRDAETGTYVAPLHMKANNGVFVIDDFGRQLISPRDLLNRWIVPLDRRMDFLTMGSGVKFAIPFEVFVVFSTNLNPSELADEAFLRRIPNKILVDAVSGEAFDEIVERRLASNGWTSQPDAKQYLRLLCQNRGGDLRPCYPRDIFGIIQSIAEFEERPPTFTTEAIDRAAELYFSAT
jgi:hypothetical protein